MTAATPAFERVTAEGSASERKALRAARIRGVVFAVLGLFALRLAIGALDAPATFSFWVDRQGGSSIVIPTTVGVLWIITGVVTGLTAILQLVQGVSFPWRRMLLVVLPVWIIATLAALLDGEGANLTGVLAGTLSLAAPIALGAFAGIISERSGINNIAIEGKFLIGACAASVAASTAMLVLGQGANPTVAVLIGILAAAIAGALVGLLLAWLGIRWKVDLSELPVLGPILFSGTPYLYFTLVVMVGLAYMLYRTRWGLRLRASGEMPSAAGTVGIDVIRIRYQAMIIAGVLAGIAGSSLSLASAGSFQMNMSAGRGWIALAAVIFGAWNPIYAFGAALVFGFADSAQALLSILGVDVPPQFLNSLPYVTTIVVVAGVVGRVRGPAAAGQPYDQG
jgi:ABC-type uncharacterized transport system permease subunit